jgi:hypothetical protein
MVFVWGLRRGRISRSHIAEEPKAASGAVKQDPLLRGNGDGSFTNTVGSRH